MELLECEGDSDDGGCHEWDKQNALKRDGIVLDADGKSALPGRDPLTRQTIQTLNITITQLVRTRRVSRSARISIDGAKLAQGIK